ncbi:MAG: hypothetical protein RTU09_08235 [Candidatus Thorarchaeota archaeon]
MLNLALATALNDLQFYLDEEAARTAPEVKALLKVLAESEETLIATIESMIISGVTTAMEEVLRLRDSATPPNEDPFEFGSAFSPGLQFERWSLCNGSLERCLKAYHFYVSISTRAKSQVVSRLFEYIAYLKGGHIERLRRVCESFGDAEWRYE